jgi:hypothetical protein
MVHLSIIQTDSTGTVLTLVDGRRLTVWCEVTADTVADVEAMVDGDVAVVANCWPYEVAAAPPLARSTPIESLICTDPRVLKGWSNHGYPSDSVYLIVRTKLTAKL